MSRDRNNSKSEITVGGPYFDEMAVFYVPFQLAPAIDERSIGFKHGDETDFSVVPSSHELLFKLSVIGARNRCGEQRRQKRYKDGWQFRFHAELYDAESLWKQTM